MRFGAILFPLLAWSCTPLAGSLQPTPSTIPPRPQPSPSSIAATTLTTPEIVTRALTPEEIVGILLSVRQPKRVESSLSPDQRWLAQVDAVDCFEVGPGEEYAYQELRLVQTGVVGPRTVDSQLIACGGLGAYGLATRFWSGNSRYLYYTTAAQGIPDGCGWWIPPLARFDTVTGQVEPLGSAVVSPDGKLLAGWLEDQLGVWRVDGERLGLLDIPSVVRIPGPIAWRPDSSSIAFLISEGTCPLGETDLGRLDLADMRPIILLSYREPAFADVRWDVPNRVTLTDENGGTWRYNFLSRDLWQVGP